MSEKKNCNDQETRDRELNVEELDAVAGGAPTSKWRDDTKRASLVVSLS